METLKGCVALFKAKIAALPGPTEKWNCKSWENARYAHNERFNFYLIWFRNESKFFKFLKPDANKPVGIPSRTKATLFSSIPLLAGKNQNMTSQNKEYLASYR